MNSSERKEMGASAVLLAGTSRYTGIAGCMHQELAARGIQTDLLEVVPDWSRHVLHRASERLIGQLSMRRLVVNAQLIRCASRSEVLYVIITNGSEMRPDTVARVRDALEQRGGGIACFLCDDPFNPVYRSASWMRSLTEYSLVVSTKRAVMPDLIAAGCRRVAYARFGYHPPVHRPIDPTAMGFSRVDVAFAGNADKDRLPIVGSLVERAPDLTFGLYGYGWGAHPALRDKVRPHVTGLQYSGAMRAGTVCPCLVRRANRDGHVMRSIELPAMGAFMLAERTEEHQEIFEEGVHCDYWSSVDELVDKSRWYARNPRRAAEIALAGHQLITTNPHTYADRALEVLEMLGRPASARHRAP